MTLPAAPLKRSNPPAMPVRCAHADPCKHTATCVCGGERSHRAFNNRRPVSAVCAVSHLPSCGSLCTNRDFSWCRSTHPPQRARSPNSLRKQHAARVRRHARPPQLAFAHLNGSYEIHGFCLSLRRSYHCRGNGFPEHLAQSCLLRPKIPSHIEKCNLYIYQ